MKPNLSRPALTKSSAGNVTNLLDFRDSHQNPSVCKDFAPESVPIPVQTRAVGGASISWIEAPACCTGRTNIVVYVKLHVDTDELTLPNLIPPPSVRTRRGFHKHARSSRPGTPSARCSCPSGTRLGRQAHRRGCNRSWHRTRLRKTRGRPRRLCE
jgi:hypothetical protein